MKLITRCPQCQTSFRVHDHQLAVRQGRVRCGACGNVFDAYSTLVEELEDTAPPEAQGVPGMPTDAVRAASRFELAPSSKAPTLGSPTSRTDPNPLHPATLPRADIPGAAEWRYDPRAIESIGEPTIPGVASAEPHAVPQITRTRRDAKAVSSAQPARAEVVAAAEPQISMPSYSIADPPVPPSAAKDVVAQDLDDDFDFGPRRASRGARIALVTGATLLALGLVGQIVYAGRSYIAAWAPTTRPALVAACGWLGCEVPLPRHTEQLVIEASDLQADGTVLTLNAVIRNRAPYEQALPALMLTLTDQREQPVARRVIEPRNYLATRPPSDASIGAGGTVNATVYVDGTDLGAASYEVQIFYR